MMGFGFGTGYGLGGLLWVLGCIALIAGLVILVVWAISRASNRDRETRSPERSEALDLLSARFARGEINEAEYTQAANVLKAAR